MGRGTSVHRAWWELHMTTPESSGEESELGNQAMRSPLCHRLRLLPATEPATEMWPMRSRKGGKMTGAEISAAFCIQATPDRDPHVNYLRAAMTLKEEGLHRWAR